MDARKPTPRHILIKRPKVKDKERILEQQESPDWCGLSAGLQTKGSLVPFPDRSHAWFMGHVLSEGGRGDMRDNHTLYDIFLPL